MNQLLQSLERVCRAHPVAEKWVVAPSQRAGHQWLDGVARGGCPVVNARCTTVTALALQLAAPQIAARELPLVMGRKGLFVLARLWDSLQSETGYLTALEPTMGLLESLWGAVRDMRLCDLHADALDPEKFEAAVKGRELIDVLRAWELALHADGAADYADVLRMATARLIDSGLDDGVRVCVPSQVGDISLLERRFLDAIPAKSRVTLVCDEAGIMPPDEAATDCLRLRCVARPAEAPPAVNDGSVDVFRAVGAANEVREVLRRCLRDTVPLDDVEILHADTDTYVPLLFELSESLRRPPEMVSDAPMTFAEGIPVMFTRPGRALAAWLEWTGGDYAQHTLARMIQDGLLATPDLVDIGSSYRSLAEALRGVPIGNGRARYAPALARAVEAARRRAARAARPDEDGDVHEERRRRAERALTELELLATMLPELVALLPDGAASNIDVLKGSLAFLLCFARRGGELDDYARRMLREEIETMARLAADGLPDGLDMRAWLVRLLRECRVAGGGPRPGSIHVAHMLTGGHSARGHTFVIGQDESRFPGAGLQDPVLLDSERRELHDELPTAAGRHSRKVHLAAETLARLRGRVTLSYACRALDDDRELLPGPLIAAVDDFLMPDLRIGLPVSFAPQDESGCLTEAEWWLWRLCGESFVADAADAVCERFPHLAAGRRAAEHRRSDEFTAWDGWVPAAGADLNPFAADAQPVSASRLQQMGKCPLAWFFKYALGISPPDTADLDREQWLDPMRKGTLLHDVFRAFMAQHPAPEFIRDWAALKGILDEHVAACRQELPVPNDAVFDDELRDLIVTCQTFLKREESRSGTHTPVGLEVSVGMTPPQAGATDLDVADPVQIALPGGQSIRARGRLDRIDAVGQAYEVWDYKSGGTWSYETPPDDPCKQGRLVQHALYVILAEAALKGGRVSAFGYYFPSPKGAGREIKFSAESLTDGRAVIERLCRIIESGAFLATNDGKSDCKFCDYAGICCDAETASADAARKLGNPENAALNAMRDLRGLNSEEGGDGG